jgi:Domain of unknown function (DUF1918)
MHPWRATRQVANEDSAGAEPVSRASTTPTEVAPLAWRAAKGKASGVPRRPLSVTPWALGLPGSSAACRSATGAPPYFVRWEDGHESEVFPGSDMFIQRFDDADQ